MKIMIDLRQAREILGFKQVHVAEHLGICQSQYSRMESGERKFSSTQVLKLSHLLGIKTEYIIQNAIPIVIYFGDMENDPNRGLEMKDILHIIEQQNKVLNALLSGKKKNSFLS